MNWTAVLVEHQSIRLPVLFCQSSFIEKIHRFGSEITALVADKLNYCVMQIYILTQITCNYQKSSI